MTPLPPRPPAAAGRGPAAAGRQAGGLRPMRAALAKMAAALRGVVAVVAVVSALLGAARGVSMWWLVPVLVAVACWTSVYVTVAWRRGLRAWLIGADLLLTAALYLVIGKVVAPGAVPGTLSWVPNVASVAVVCAQLAGMPAVSVPAGLLVAASAVAGSRLAHSADGGVPAATLLATQAVIAAAVMVVALRTERAAVSAFTSLQKAEEAAVLAAVGRQDERAQLRIVHNNPLTTLTMALSADPERLGEVLRRHAAATLAALPQLAAGNGPETGEARLDERLAQIVVLYQPPLTVAADLPPCLVPVPIAEAFTGAVREALENVARHAGTPRAAVRLRDGEHAVTVTVADRGRGFDPAGPPRRGFGLREDMAGRMEAVGGSAAVRSVPGAGTEVDLEWRRA